ncbi:MAG: hypothetical protein FD181_3085 [Prolixibacteraceae bacterium]|nr:MAG: hypothetical protein FD181_3085 [Prolixibacteraceae bacterium]
MKTKNFILILMVAFYLSGCVIWSFYPLYTEKDLFENEILTGNWTDGDGLQWKFKHPERGNTKSIDKKLYELHLTDYDNKETTYNVNIIQLKGIYFLDFYISEIAGANNSDSDAKLNYWNLHVIPVHTFAKLTVTDNTLQINWFDGDWLKEQIEEKKIKIAHEKNDESLLLTAKTADLQKLSIKYANTEAAFKDGLVVELKRN